MASGLFIAPLRKDLLELAIAFQANANAWGQMRALSRWTAKQPWRKILPKTFQKLDFINHVRGDSELVLVTSQTKCVDLKLSGFAMKQLRIQLTAAWVPNESMKPRRRYMK